jgi:hypothetical protein
MYWKLHTGMSEELYGSLRDLLDILEAVYSRHKEDASVSEKLKAALDSAVLKIKEIDA